jgi:hypothetical protein
LCLGQPWTFFLIKNVQNNTPIITFSLIHHILSL